MKTNLFIYTALIAISFGITGCTSSTPTKHKAGTYPTENTKSHKCEKCSTHHQSGEDKSHSHKSAKCEKGH